MLYFMQYLAIHSFFFDSPCKNYIYIYISALQCIFFIAYWYFACLAISGIEGCRWIALFLQINSRLRNWKHGGLYLRIYLDINLLYIYSFYSQHFLYIYILCLSVCLLYYLINVQTAEPIRSKFFLISYGLKVHR